MMTQSPIEPFVQVWEITIKDRDAKLSEKFYLEGFNFDQTILLKAPEDKIKSLSGKMKLKFNSQAHQMRKCIIIIPDWAVVAEAKLIEVKGAPPKMCFDASDVKDAN